MLTLGPIAVSVLRLCIVRYPTKSSLSCCLSLPRSPHLTTDGPEFGATWPIDRMTGFTRFSDSTAWFGPSYAMPFCVIVNPQPRYTTGTVLAE
jgi:hypothetical protein